METPSQTPENVEKNPRKKPGFTSVLVPVAVILATILVSLEYLHQHRSDSHSETPGATAAPAARKVGEPITDFEVKTVDGKATKLSDVKSKVVLINFWATWCGPCVKEMPSIEKLYDAYKDRGFTVLGVSLDEDPEKVLDPFLKKLGIKFPIFSDPQGNVADLFQISGLPLTLVVEGGTRKLLYEQMGDDEWDSPEIRKQLELWLGGEKK